MTENKELTKEQKTLISEAIKELSKDLRTNLYVKGQAQFTDMTNRDYFLKAYGKNIRYCKLWNKFLVWNGSKWELDDDGKVEEFAVDFIREMYRSSRYIKDPQLAIDFEKHLIKSESFRRIQALVGMCKMTKDIKIRSDILDSNNYLLNTKNCSVNLQSYKVKEADRNDFASMCSNFVYEPGAKCPTWEHFLLQIMNQDTEIIHFIQKAMGYALTGDISEQCLFILWGCGANGKSTFLNTIQNLLGDYACSARTETFMKKTSDQSNDLARLRGMRLVTTSESEQNGILSESLIKQITGEDEITARFLYGEYFSFKPTFKIFMATNHKPRIKGGDYGIWRRIKLIPFNVTIPVEQRDKHLLEKLEKENSGILNWLLQGFIDWKKEGLKDPDSVRNATEEYKDDMDSVGAFLKECCVIDASGVTRLSNRILYDTYIRWCTKNNERVGSQKYLALRLQEKGFRRAVSNSVRFWVGIGVRAEWVN